MELYRPARLHRLQPPLGRENLQQHVIHLSTTYRIRIPSTPPTPPPQCSCQCVSPQTLQDFSIDHVSILSLTVSLLGAHASGGGEINYLYTHKYTFSTTHPDTKLYQNSSVSLSLCFFIVRSTLNLQQLILSSHTKLLKPIFSHSTVFY